MPNIYYDPEKFGLRPVFETDKSSRSYEFNTFVIWQTEAGDFVWASDSGCSCPAPFEDYHMDNVARGSLRDAYTDAVAWLGDDPGWYDYWKEARKDVKELHDRVEFLERKKYGQRRTGI